jgi:hypothetical protein
MKKNYKMITEQEFNSLPHKQGIYILNLYQGKSYYLKQVSTEEELTRLESMLVSGRVE